MLLQCCSGTSIQKDLCGKDEFEDGPLKHELTFQHRRTVVTQQRCKWGEKKIEDGLYELGNEM